MISQSLFLRLNSQTTYTHDTRDEMFTNLFARPHVLAIHRPSGRGVYLDECGQHMVSVRDCREPESPVKIARGYLHPITNSPEWIESGFPGGTLEFDSFWLY